MDTRINCFIDDSLSEIFRELSLPEFIQKTFISSNDDFTQTNDYSILILNNEKYPLDSKVRFRSEESFDAIGYYNKYINNGDDIIKACEVLLYILNKPGVLSYDQIRSLTKLGILIYQANEKNIQFASYDLSLHREFLRSGVDLEEEDIISIDPFAYVIVGAKEFANLPTNICANYDLQVSMFCRGIILSNGPQVDPGYRGALLSLLFNTSSKPFDMPQYEGYQFATIQFLALSSPSTRRYSGQNLLKNSIGEYIRKYADESMSERVATLLSLKDENELIQKNIKSINTKLESHDQKITSQQNCISNLTGKHTKWTIIATCVVGGIAVLYAAISIFSDTAKVYDLFFNIGNCQEKINYTESRLTKLSSITNVLENKQISYDNQLPILKDQINLLKEKIISINKKTELIESEISKRNNFSLEKSVDQSSKK